MWENGDKLLQLPRTFRRKNRVDRAGGEIAITKLLFARYATRLSQVFLSSLLTTPLLGPREYAAFKFSFN